VLNGVSLTIEPGTIHGVIGPNGAGKTTLLDAITGFAPLVSGSVTLGQDNIEHLPAWRRSKAGIGRSFQSLELFEDLTVYDNLLVASEMQKRANLAADLVGVGGYGLGAAAVDAVQILELESRLDHRISELTYGDRHLVALARALATDADVLLLDEPAAGLDESEVEEFGRLARRVVEQRGVSLLLIEHDVSLVMALSDQVTVLNFGEVIASGTPDEVRVNEDVIASYLGASSATSEMLAESDGFVGRSGR
jgi:ABC-type branched-subunit amino acid transport system ATPase component